MCRTEYPWNGRTDRIRHYSDANMYLLQEDTGIDTYIEAIDPYPTPHTYAETNNPVPTPEEDDDLPDLINDVSGVMEI